MSIGMKQDPVRNLNERAESCRLGCGYGMLVFPLEVNRT